MGETYRFKYEWIGNGARLGVVDGGVNIIEAYFPNFLKANL